MIKQDELYTQDKKVLDDIIAPSMEERTSATPVLINRYLLEKTIGTGGMAVVYVAQDMLLERKVAVKVLRKDYSQNPEFQNSFRAEAKAIAKLSHINIVIIHDFGFDAGRLFIVMEYVDGNDLKSIIREKGIFQENEAIQIILQACDGLGYAHKNGLVHCDIKPHNFIISKSGLLKITDFGIARALETIQADEQHDTVWGSPLYFSPEQAAGKAPSPASDVYSLGIILYEMICGWLPFRSEDANELARLHRERKPIAPKRIVKDLSDGLNKVILKATAKEASERFTDAAQFGKALQELIDKPIHKEVSKPIRKARPQKSNSDDTKKIKIQHQKKEGIDWAAILLGLLALIAAGGLVPFWLYVWFTINATGR